MADYLPLHEDGHQITRAASGTITGGNLVSVSGSGTVAQAAAGDPTWLGVAGFDVVSGNNLTVWCSGVQRIVAGTGGVTAGQLVQAGANGTVVSHTNGTNDFNVVGIALTTATATNLVEVKMAR
jgi:hypothetical protein